MSDGQPARYQSPKAIVQINSLAPLRSVLLDKTHELLLFFSLRSVNMEAGMSIPRLHHVPREDEASNSLIQRYIMIY